MFTFALVGLLVPDSAEAIPVFAHRYGLSCQACHTEVPHLNPAGTAFLANGYRFPGAATHAVFPVAVRAEFTYASGGAADPDDIRGPLPKAIVDEVEFLSGGSVGSRGSYWAEQYLVDGGFPGSTRDVWYAQRLTPDGAHLPLLLRAGQFTLPLPLDPETFRETTQPYAIWSQTAGNNPFNFFDTKLGLQASVGDPARSLSGTFSLLQGHDTQSGLPADGLDSMLTLRRDLGPVRLGLYRYDGERNVAGFGFNDTQFFSGIPDRFWRDGYSAGWSSNRTEVDAVYQIGHDSAADVYGDSLIASGGFLQVRQSIGDRAFGIARWDATQGGAFARSLTAGLGTRFSRNTRFTLFDTAERDYLGRPLNVISSSFLVAY
ncbi:MAG: hypothetical protein ACLPYS_04030 [Vulcanimicrobiaceae bacterium]